METTGPSYRLLAQLLKTHLKGWRSLSSRKLMIASQPANGHTIRHGFRIMTLHGCQIIDIHSQPGAILG